MAKMFDWAKYMRKLDRRGVYYLQTDLDLEVGLGKKKETDAEEGYLRPSKVAKFFDVHSQTIYSWIDRGIIKDVIMIGTTVRIPKSEVKRLKQMRRS